MMNYDTVQLVLGLIIFGFYAYAAYKIHKNNQIKMTK